MAEQTFRSPGFFEQEIDLSARKVTPIGVPAGVVGTAERGPAFVPITVGSFADFETKFGTLDTDRFGPYAVREFLKHRTALTYMRVLGAGSNESAAEISTTNTEGTVKNAGFQISGSYDIADLVGGCKNKGDVKFLVAQHTAPAQEAVGFPVFTDNDSFFSSRTAASNVNLVRAVILCATGTTVQILDPGAAYSHANTAYDLAGVAAIDGSPLTDAKYFKLALSSSAGTSFGNDDSAAGVRVLTASLDPNDGNYISKVLNTDPLKFEEEEHLLYLDFAVENELATIASGTVATIALISGSAATSAGTNSTDDFNTLFGRYDTRYTTPQTTAFISQPYGFKEFDLFHFETLSDGAYANDKFKVSIANLRASTDPNNSFGSFEVQIRKFSDTDTNQEILERYPDVNLNPSSDRYIARQIGDKKVHYDFDQEDPDERRLVIQGKYPNVSQRVRIRMNVSVENKDVPDDVLPFGFRGVPVIKTSDTLTDASTSALTASNGTILGQHASRRLAGKLTGSTAPWMGAKVTYLSGAIVPPLPFRFKVTRGGVFTGNPKFVGQVGTNERVDGRFYWGVKTTRVPLTSSLTNALLNTNVSSVTNPFSRRIYQVPRNR